MGKLKPIPEVLEEILQLAREGRLRRVIIEYEEEG